MAPSPEAAARHVSSFELEAIRLGLAPPAERASAERHLAGCADCRSLAGSLAELHREFTSEVLERTLPKLCVAGQRRDRRVALGFSVAGALAAGAAAFLVLARPQLAQRHPTAGEAEYWVKGSPALIVAVRRGERVFRAEPGTPLRPGDRIRFVVERVEQAFVLIVSVDGSGQANVYVPYGGTQSVPLGAGSRRELEGSIVLDDGPGPERIFALFSSEPLPVKVARDALTAIGLRGAAAIRATSRLQVGASEQATVLIEKVLP